MVKRLYVVLALGLGLVLHGTAFAQQDNPQRPFDQANQQLQEGNIGQALDIYRQLEDRDTVSGALYLNMGLSYIQVDSMGMAKYYFMKARAFEETRNRAAEGLDYVETRFSHQSALLPELPWQKALNWLSESLGPAVLLGIGLILFNLGILVYIGGWFISTTGKAWERAAIGTAALGCLVILLSMYTDYREQRYSKAVMVTREASVRELPAQEAALVNQAYEGYTFVVDHNESDTREGWSYIRMSNGLYGWIPTHEIMIL